MRLLENGLFLQDVDAVCGLDLPWEKLRGKTILISGATGMIGSMLIHVLMRKNGWPRCSEGGLFCRIIALGRSREKARQRFSEYLGDPRFLFVPCDIADAAGLRASLDEAYGRADIDYCFHAASNTHPVAYATDPIGTVTANIIALNNLLELSAERGCRRFVFASSNEIYGENRGDAERFDEHYCGFIDCNSLRAGYPESKRAGEALCQAYIRQKNLDAVIVRFTRTFGPTMLMSDTKAVSQFIRNGVRGENIVLKSRGEQYYSYSYVCDAVSGFLTVLLKGQCGEAYNVADELCDIRLKDLAAVIARQAGTKVVFEVPDDVEAAGYSKATKALLDPAKIQKLGWKAQFDLQAALGHTLAVLKETG